MKYEFKPYLRLLEIDGVYYFRIVEEQCNHLGEWINRIKAICDSSDRIAESDNLLCGVLIKLHEHNYLQKLDPCLLKLNEAGIFEVGFRSDDYNFMFHTFFEGDAITIIFNTQTTKLLINYNCNNDSSIPEIILATSNIFMRAIDCYFKGIWNNIPITIFSL